MVATSAADTSTGPRRIQRVPATFGQQRLWFMEQLQPGSVAYLGAWSIRLSGDLRVDVLEETLNEIVQRHKIFRTTFAGADGDVVAIVDPAVNAPKYANRAAAWQRIVFRKALCHDQRLIHWLASRHGGG